VAKRLDADVCSIYLTDADLRHLTLSATIGLDPAAVARVRLDFGEGLVGQTASRGAPIALEHAREDPHYRYFPETGEERYESFLAVPLLMQGATTGVLVIQTVEARRFDKSDIELLQTCAQLVAPVVVNAQLLALMSGNDERRSRFVSGQSESSLADSERAESNVELRGIATARGVAIGPIYQAETLMDLQQLEYVPNEALSQERDDLLEALAGARREIEDMREAVGERFGPEFAAVFHTQIQILEDKGFVQNLEQTLVRQRNALLALRSVLDSYRHTFESIEDPYFRERGADIVDVGQRIMEKLLGVRHHVRAMEPGSVVVVDQVLAGLFAKLEMDKVAAIVSEHGGFTSHGAIFARTLEIPAVTGVSGIRAEARIGETCIVDGTTGRVYLSPDDALLSYYQQAQHKFTVAAAHLDAMRERPAETRDGHPITLSANVGLLNDLRLIEQHGASAIGLFRTELLALAHRGFPSQEEQEQLYRRVVDQMSPRKVTIRTLDLGGDKGIPNIGVGKEDNPQLGCRSIRLTLENRRAFSAQLRAVLRVSTAGNVRLLFPMISGIGELREANEVLAEVRDQLDREGEPYDRNMPVGIMVEVPSAAIISETLAPACDFFSIGTNDLTQYTLAVDRGNERVAHLYDALHPAVLTLIDRTAKAGRAHGIPVSVCGEMASNPLAVPILVGLGIGDLSGVPAAVPVMKEIVRALDAADAAEDARQALSVSTPDEVHVIAAARLRSAGLLEHPDIGEWLRGLVDEAVGPF